MTIETTPGYNSWRQMRQRCCNPNNSNYPMYGAKGVTVCDAWSSFKTFIEDMGPQPEGTTLDRFPLTKGNYEPNNCRWATPLEQTQNRDFFLRTTTSPTPYISKLPNNTFKVQITITKGNKARRNFPTLEQAESFRDICVYERDFLKLRGLTYD